MANSYYQLITKPKLYVSYPLFQYANGALDLFRNYGDNWSQQDMIRMLQLDPSNQTIVSPDDVYRGLQYRLLPSGQFDDMTKIFNFDFLMILGHNFASTGAKIKLHADNDVIEVDPTINTTNLVNYQQWSNIEYDGWSLANITQTGSVDAYNLRLGIAPVENSYLEKPLRIGSIMWGKSFTFPQNADLSETVSFDYGVKQKQTISGKTISTANWTKPNNWITEPFGLGSQAGDNFQRRSGRRSWKMQFDSLAPDKVMNQNMMMNSNGFTAQDNHSTAADSVESLYNINDATDFYTNVVHRSMSSHLPMVLQIDKNDNSPSNFAIVRMNKDYTIKQKSPNLYSISVTLTEQI